MLGHDKGLKLMLRGLEPMLYNMKYLRLLSEAYFEADQIRKRYFLIAELRDGSSVSHDQLATFHQHLLHTETLSEELNRHQVKICKRQSKRDSLRRRRSVTSQDISQMHHQISRILKKASRRRRSHDQEREAQSMMK